MIHCNNIVVPVDFSAPSRAAFDHACEFAEQFGAALHVVHVRHLNRADAEFGGDAVVQTFDEFAQETERQMTEFLGDTGAFCFPVEPVFRDGKPVDEIVRYADDIGADMIIIGTHGRSGLMHIVMGSVAEGVIRNARCDVLTVHQREHDRHQSTALSESAAKST